jgi:repressor LexA
MMARKSAGLGERHYHIMEYLLTFQNKKNYSPSIRQIGESIGVSSTSLVDYYLKQLEEQGYIERDANVSRSIRILRPLYAAGGKAAGMMRQAGSLLNDLVSLPLMGRIVASLPIPVPPSDLAYFDAESTVEIARSMLPQKEKVEELFALEVQGDSMIDAMVNDGDIVVMKQTKEAVNGDMVAVWLNDNDETTLKYFYKEKNSIRLQPANPTMQPIIINNPKQVRVMGKVVMVIRQIRPAVI